MLYCQVRIRDNFNVNSFLIFIYKVIYYSYSLIPIVWIRDIDDNKYNMPTKSPKDVVLAAFHYLAEVIPPTQKIAEVRVEAIQPLTESSKIIWRLVLSYDNVGDFPFDKKREYKEFRVDDFDARVLEMKPVDEK